jgi:hypothetical protein
VELELELGGARAPVLCCPGRVGWLAGLEPRRWVFFTTSSAKEEALDSAVRGWPPCSAAALFFASVFRNGFLAGDRSVCGVSGRDFSAGGGQQRRERTVTAAVSGASKVSSTPATRTRRVRPAPAGWGLFFFSSHHRVSTCMLRPLPCFWEGVVIRVLFCLVLDKC